MNDVSCNYFIKRAIGKLKFSDISLLESYVFEMTALFSVGNELVTFASIIGIVISPVIGYFLILILVGLQIQLVKM